MQTVSYKRLRTLIGILGILLPILVVTLNFLNPKCHGLEGSISDYHNTIVRNIFVGILCLTSGFLICYNGYDKRDSIITKLAGVFALLISMFPTNVKISDGSVICDFIRPQWFPIIHNISAISFFLLLTYMTLFQFTKSNNKSKNKIYKICGWTMLLSLIFIGFYNIFPSICTFNCGILIGETVALWAFGISWLVKGDEIKYDNISKLWKK